MLPTNLSHPSIDCMNEITARKRLPPTLHDSGTIPKESSICVRELSRGVSNIVMRVDIAGQPSFVLKQCREKLRVAMEWHARLDRIWAERATLELLGSILTFRGSAVPTVLFEDRPNPISSRCPRLPTIRRPGRLG